MTVPSIDTVQSWQGRTMVDPAGDKLGTIDAIYLDNETGQPEWATVTSGMFTAKTAFVPLAQAQDTGDIVQVPYDKQQVTDAPRMEADGSLSQDDEAELYRHYGLEYSEHRADGGLRGRRHDPLRGGAAGRDRDPRARPGPAAQARGHGAADGDGAGVAYRGRRRPGPALSRGERGALRQDEEAGVPERDPDHDLLRELEPVAEQLLEPASVHGQGVDAA